VGGVLEAIIKRREPFDLEPLKAVDGTAKNMDRERWDETVREYFLIS
jgi:hypothetical protein